MKEIFNILNDWVEKLYPDLDVEKIFAESETAKKKKEEKERKEKERQAKIDKGEI